MSLSAADRLDILELLSRADNAASLRDGAAYVALFTEDGIFHYKKAFAPEGVVQFFTGQRIFDRDGYDRLVTARRNELSAPLVSDFFPAYRAPVGVT